MNKQAGSNQIFLAALALTGTAALALQLYLIIQNRATSITEALIRYFSFFTIQSNILVTVCAFMLLLAPLSGLGKFFSKPATQSAITVYIFIVGLVYNLVLRQIWQPAGVQKLVDELLHVGMPLLFVLFWILYTPKNSLKWNVAPWLIYPALYAAYSFIRGAFTGYYPYPFLDVGKLGFTQVAINTCGLVAVFMFFSLLLVGIARRLFPKG